MEHEVLSDMLDLMSDAKVAKKVSRHISTMRGIRGVPDGEIARIATAAWLEQRPRLPDDEDSLSQLFSTAWEDGLVAVGLLAALVPDCPEEVLDVGRDWLTRVDDTPTADAIGWMVIGPSMLASGEDLTLLWRRSADAHPTVRRAVVMTGMALLPEPITGPSAAPLRARLKNKRVRFVDTAQSEALSVLADRYVRDTDPGVRKALRRVLGAWAAADPDAAEAWCEGVSGGIPKMYRDEVARAARKTRRKQSRGQA